MKIFANGEIEIKGLVFHVYEVTEHDKIGYKVREDGTSVVRTGYCDFVTNTIYILYGNDDLTVKLPSVNKHRALLHELTHAYMEAYGFHGAEILWDEEAICEFMAVYGRNITVDCEIVKEQLMASQRKTPVSYL